MSKENKDKAELIDDLMFLQTNATQVLSLLEEFVDMLPEEHISQEGRASIKGAIHGAQTVLQITYDNI